MQYMKNYYPKKVCAILSGVLISVVEAENIFIQFHMIITPDEILPYGHIFACILLHTGEFYSKNFGSW